MGRIAIIGGGAAGLMAAIRAAESDRSEIVLFEKMPVCGKKLSITGKGRCNLTCAATVEEMERFVPRGARFLRTALYAFPPEWVVSFFEERGVPLKTERGGRIFPQSDRAGDVVAALVKAALARPNLRLKRERVCEVCRQKENFAVVTESGTTLFDRVLIATGGLSYPATGSTGDGYEFARKLGHRVTPLSPSLCPLTVEESLCGECMGLSLKNTRLTVKDETGKKAYEGFGELMFTHFGLSGPLALSASAYLTFSEGKTYTAVLDMKPALTQEEADRRLLADLEKNSNRDLINSLSRLLPQKIILPLIRHLLLDPRKKVNLLSRTERRRLLEGIKGLTLTVTGHRPIREAIITRGGIDPKEIDPRTMESKLVSGLYFAGEILDADALTGGYNLQIAFATGALAGDSITREDL